MNAAESTPRPEGAERIQPHLSLMCPMKGWWREGVPALAALYPVVNILWKAPYSGEEASVKTQLLQLLLCAATASQPMGWQGTAAFRVIK